MSLIFAAQVRELECARVAIRLRWAEMLYFFENFVLDPARRELRRGNALITVQPQVFDLLEYLITNRDRVVSKDNILEAVWGGRIVSESALTTRINATRTAIGDDGDQQQLIRTIPRKGIRFVGVVREQPRPADESAAARAVVETEALEWAAASRDEAVSAERRQLTIASCELLVRTMPTTADPEDLSEILQQRALLGSNAAIAKALDISVQTVDVHLRSARKKMKVEDTAIALLEAYKRRLIEY
jgi:DNA-binding winged helix-turn-helix (wHTH) protein/DNA-binding CsgD family transcriptional regulator